jgi:ergothioneine biosynthesis protein EgtB
MPLARPRADALGDPGPSVSALDLDRDTLWNCFEEVRSTTEGLCVPLEIEDYLVQSMPDASPAKWHLAHTSWFFETFVLAESFPGGWSPVDERYGYLFNSYYNAVGERISRDRRGLLSRPTVSEVYQYRAAIDERMKEWLGRVDDETFERLRPTIVLGFHHEQQHQELIVTDLKHALANNPLCPAYLDRAPLVERPGRMSPMGWVRFEAGLRSIGHGGGTFAFDNETPRHPQYVAAFEMADRLVTNREYLEFVAERGYERPELWLSDGWFARGRLGWTAPLYWQLAEKGQQAFTLLGMRELDPDAPACHLSYYEADAFARWAGARLATEAEWETAATSPGAGGPGNFLENERFEPVPLTESASSATVHQLLGDVWEWTRSPYTAYDGFRPAAGALGEYNGKFMCNQFVLRGGSCATPRSHIRATYRNFFPPEARWQFTGIRLARDV